MQKDEQNISSVVQGPEPQYPIESVDNCLKIISLLKDNQDIRQRDVAEYLGVAGSTAHRLLAMLHYRGFLRRDPGRKAYRPGAILTLVSYSVLREFDPQEALRPVLETLHEDVLETVHLGALEGETVRFIDAIESPHAVRVASRLGQSRPASSTATGKALLAQLPLPDLRRLYPITTQEGNAIDCSTTYRTGLEQELEQVREQGFAMSEEGNEDGVSSVAIALPKGGYPLRLAMNVSLPVSRFLETDLERILGRLKHAVTMGAGLLH